MIEKDQIDKKVDFDKYISIAKKNIYQFIDIKNNSDIDPDINIHIVISII